MIAEIIKSITVSSYQIRDVKTLKITVASGSPSWRPGDRVIVSESLIVGKASDASFTETVRV